jgi:hypothetical protein
MRASVVCDSRFTQIRAKAGSPSDFRRCIPISDVQATALAARLFQSAFGAKGLCGDVDRSALTGWLSKKCGGSKPFSPVSATLSQPFGRGTSPVSATLSPDARSCDIPLLSPAGDTLRRFAPIKRQSLTAYGFPPPSHSIFVHLASSLSKMLALGGCATV